MKVNENVGFEAELINNVTNAEDSKEFSFDYDGEGVFDEVPKTEPKVEEQKAELEVKPIVPEQKDSQAEELKAKLEKAIAELETANKRVTDNQKSFHEERLRVKQLEEKLKAVEALSNNESEWFTSDDSGAVMPIEKTVEKPQEKIVNVIPTEIEKDVKETKARIEAIEAERRVRQWEEIQKPFKTKYSDYDETVNWLDNEIRNDSLLKNELQRRFDKDGGINPETVYQFGAHVRQLRGIAKKEAKADKDIPDLNINSHNAEIKGYKSEKNILDEVFNI